jgi:hypothetical protein
MTKGLMRADVRKQLGGTDWSENLKSLVASSDAENHLDGPHIGRVISDEYHGGGLFG